MGAGEETAKDAPAWAHRYRDRRRPRGNWADSVKLLCYMDGRLHALVRRSNEAQEQSGLANSSLLRLFFPERPDVYLKVQMVTRNLLYLVQHI